MNLTPDDVEQVRFRVALRGYAEDEVDLFLDRVVETLENLQAELLQVRRELQEAQAVPAPDPAQLLDDTEVSPPEMHTGSSQNPGGEAEPSGSPAGSTYSDRPSDPHSSY